MIRTQIKVLWTVVYKQFKAKKTLLFTALLLANNLHFLYSRATAESVLFQYFPSSTIACTQEDNTISL